MAQTLLQEIDEDVHLENTSIHVSELMAQTLLQEIDEDVDRENRRNHRLEGYFAVLRSNDYIYVR